MGAFFVYLLHWVFVVFALALSWRRGRSLLHAHFLFTASLCVHVSDFLVRGYNDENIEFIPRESLYYYQIIILAALLLTVLITASIRDHNCEQYVYEATRNVRTPASLISLTLLLAWTLVIAEVVKRLISVDWSIDELINQSLAPRFDRIWVAEAYYGNFIFSLITILLPFAGVAFAFALANCRGLRLVIAALGFLLSLSIVITDGARTPVALALGALWLFLFMRFRSILVRSIMTGAIMGAVAGIFSLMILYRSFGYHDLSEHTETQSFALTYHQDDSYYRALYASDYSDRTGKSWDPIRFALITAANPIPRFFWADKPVIDEAFMDGFKLFHTSMLYYGELVAMFGVELAMVAAVLLGTLLYCVFFRAQKILKYPLGLASYLCVALYAYMVLRSLSSITHFMYLPLFAVAASICLGKWRGAATRRLVQSERQSRLGLARAPFQTRR
jgi:hypothetical protein